MAWITAAVLYLSSRLVLWMRFLYLDEYEKFFYGILDGYILHRFPDNYREVTIKNIAIFYFPFVDLCFLLYFQYDKFYDSDIYFWPMGKLNYVRCFHKRT